MQEPHCCSRHWSHVQSTWTNMAAAVAPLQGKTTGLKNQPYPPRTPINQYLRDTTLFEPQLENCQEQLEVRGPSVRSMHTLVCMDTSHAPPSTYQRPVKELLSNHGMHPLPYQPLFPLLARAKSDQTSICWPKASQCNTSIYYPCLDIA